MQVPIGSDLLPDLMHEGGALSATVQDGVVLSFKSQLKLRALYQYVESCRVILTEVREILSLDEPCREEPKDISEKLQRVSERLEMFCTEADSWGFNALYEISLGLQMLLLNGGGRISSEGFREAFQRGLSMLSALLEQCERDFVWRLATADLLDCFDLAGRA